jgi:hypothetical protein
MWRSGASEALVDFCPRPAQTYSEPVGGEGDQASEEKYTPKQDVQLGKEAASEARKQYPIIGDQHIAKYLTQIGNRRADAERERRPGEPAKAVSPKPRSGEGGRSTVHSLRSREPTGSVRAGGLEWRLHHASAPAIPHNGERADCRVVTVYEVPQ